MFLGGAEKSLELIEYANKQGYETYLCDNTENPGQKIILHDYNVSAGDVDGVAEIIKNQNIDGVLSYSSDVLAVKQAEIAHKSGVLGNPVDSAKILTQKNLFRQFLREHNFNEPYIATFTAQTFDENDNLFASFPMIIKPVDSAGSSGVSLVYEKTQIMPAFEYALKYSKSGQVIFEKFIENKYPYVIAGDVFVCNNEVVFYGICNERRNNKVNQFLPISTFFPAFLSQNEMAMVKKDISRLVKEVGFEFGGMNVEMMFDKSGKLYFLELAPRNGGNCIPDQIAYTFGVNIKNMLVDASLGKKFDEVKSDYEKITCTYILHSYKDGVLKNIVVDDKIKQNVVKQWNNKHIGDTVENFVNATKMIGLILFEFESVEKLEWFLENSDELINVDVQ